MDEAKKTLVENESTYKAMNFPSVGSCISNMPDPPISVSWLVMMLTNIGQQASGISSGLQNPAKTFKIGHFSDISDLFKYWCLKKHNSR